MKHPEIVEYNQMNGLEDILCDVFREDEDRPTKVTGVSNGGNGFGAINEASLARIGISNVSGLNPMGVMQGFPGKGYGKGMYGGKGGGRGLGAKNLLISVLF
jgi:hypothetical protein